MSAQSCLLILVVPFASVCLLFEGHYVARCMYAKACSSVFCRLNRVPNACKVCNMGHGDCLHACVLSRCAVLLSILFAFVACTWGPGIVCMRVFCPGSHLPFSIL
jgi:hypothetical protein